MALSQHTRSLAYNGHRTHIETYQKRPYAIVPHRLSHVKHTECINETPVSVPPRLHGGAARVLRRRRLLRNQADEPAAPGQGPRQPGRQVRPGHMLKRYRDCSAEVHLAYESIRLLGALHLQEDTITCDIVCMFLSDLRQ